MRRPAYVKRRSRLDENVEFFKHGGERDKFNALAKEGWVSVFKTRCAVYPTPGFERPAVGQKTAVKPILIEVRSEARTQDIDSSYRCEVKGVTYEIIGPAEQAERGDNMRFVAAFVGGKV